MFIWDSVVSQYPHRLKTKKQLLKCCLSRCTGAEARCYTHWSEDRDSVWLAVVLSLPCRVNINVYYDTLTYVISLCLALTLSLSLTADRSWQCTSPPLIFKSLVPFYVIYFLLQFIFIPSISIHLLHSSSPSLTSFTHHSSIFMTLPPFSLSFPLSLLFVSSSIMSFSLVLCALTQSMSPSIESMLHGSY